MAAYLVLANNETRAIINYKQDERTGTYFRQKALLGFNTESYLARDWTLELKSGKKLYFHQNDLGIMDENGVSLASVHTSSTKSGWVIYFEYNRTADRYYLCAHTQEVYDVRSGVYTGGVFINNESYYQGTSSIRTWNNWISTWQQQSGYPDYVKYFDGMNFDLNTGDCEIHWWNNDLNQGSPYHILYATESVPVSEYVNITNYMSPEDLSDTPFVGYLVSTNLVGCTADSENPSSIPSTATSTQFKFTPDTNRYFDLQSVYITGADYSTENPAPYNWNYNTGVLTVYQITCNITINVGAYTTPYSGGGESEPGSGNPTYDFNSDEIQYSEPPILGGLNSGFVTLYTPTMAEIQNLARYMWSDAFDLDSFKRLFAEPMDVIIGLSILPLTETELGAVSDSIWIGDVNTNKSAKRVTNQYVTIDCGFVELSGMWGAYLDYSPYTKLQLYLPYIGFVELSADDCMNRIVHIIYNIDVYSGACLAQIYCKDDSDTDEQVLYQFSGNCASWYPITSGQYQYFLISAYNILSGVGMGLAEVGSGIEDLISRKATVADKMATGDSSPTGGISEAIGKMIRGSVSSGSAIASNVLASIKPSVQRAGGAGGSSFMMGPQKPYFIITTPRMIIPGEQNKMVGYPSYVTMRLGSLNGFTVVDTIHPDGIEATDDEVAEIVSLLHSGVFL